MVTWELRRIHEQSACWAQCTTHNSVHRSVWEKDMTAVALPTTLIISTVLCFLPNSRQQLILSYILKAALWAKLFTVSGHSELLLLVIESKILMNMSAAVIMEEEQVGSHAQVSAVKQLSWASLWSTDSWRWKLLEFCIIERYAPDRNAPISLSSIPVNVCRMQLNQHQIILKLHNPMQKTWTPAPPISKLQISIPSLLSVSSQQTCQCNCQPATNTGQSLSFCSWNEPASQHTFYRQIQSTTVKATL